MSSYTNVCGTLCSLLAFTACAGTRSLKPTTEYPTTAGDKEVSFVQIGDSIPSDPTMDSLVAPFRTGLAGNLSRVIGLAAGVFENGRPEGTLGNLATAAMIRAAEQTGNGDVDIAVTNAGGLRIPIQPGPVTLGVIYEVAPFDNALTILEMDSAQVARLADQIAQLGGEPVDGLTLTVDPDSRIASDIRVQGRSLQGNRRYRVVTLDYLVDGGGQMRALSSFLTRTDLPVLLRDALIEFIEASGEIVPVLDGRITFANTHDPESKP